MKQAILKWLTERFAEHSSIIGLGILCTGGWQLYAAMHAADANAESQATMLILGGLVAFVTKDGNIVDTVKSITGSKSEAPVVKPSDGPGPPNSK